MGRLTMDGWRAGRFGAVAALVAVAAIGVGGERWASAGRPSAVPLAASVPSVIVPLAPARILDTRSGVGAPVGRVAPGATVTLQVTGVGGVPADATGVVLNLTATVADGAGYVTAYPAGDTKPDASVINYSAGEDVANMVTAQLGAGGALAIFNDQANVHLLADVAGYLVPGSGVAGPQGPIGPAGPAGPGATVIVNALVPNAPGIVTVATVGGFALGVRCGSGMNETQLDFDADASGLLRIAATRQNPTGNPTLINVGSASGEAAVTDGGFSWFKVSGVVDAAGVSSTIDLAIAVGSPNCRVWGSIVPAG